MKIMTDQIHELNVTKLTLDGQKITTVDLIVLMTKYEIMNNDKKMQKVLSYMVMLYENGHNGLYLKAEPKYTINEQEKLDT